MECLLAGLNWHNLTGITGTIKPESVAQIEPCYPANTTGIHVSGNYAFSEKYSVLLNGSYSFGNFTNFNDLINSNDVDPNGYHDFAHQYIETGFGRYNLFRSSLNMEVFAGIGYGLAKDDEYISNVNSELDYQLNYMLGFLQANIGYRSDLISAGGGVRIAYSNFDFEYPYDNNLQTYHNSVNFNNLHIEPILFMKFGRKKLKFVYKASLSLVYPQNLSDELDANKGISEGEVYTTPLLVAFGVNYTFK